MQIINYFKEYLSSKLHLGFGLATLGVGLLSGSWLVLIIGIVAYGLGFMFLPDLPAFKKVVDEKYAAIQRQKDIETAMLFRQKRDRQLMSLTPSRQNKYGELAKLCKEIEASTMETISSEDAASDSRQKKLDDLIFTYLKLLSIEQSIQIFLETETKEDVKEQIAEAYEDVKRTTEEIKTLNSETSPDRSTLAMIESKQRILVSYTDKLEVLKKRLERVHQAKGNIELVNAEQSRLAEQVKLLRADVVASRNAESISSRIDASVSNLDETNKWLSQMNEFKDVVGDTAPSNIRIGFEVPERNMEVEDSPSPYSTTRPKRTGLKVSRG